MEQPTYEIQIPDGLDHLLDEITCQILKHRPENILLFVAEFLEAKLRKSGGPGSGGVGSGIGDSRKNGMQGDHNGKDVNGKNQSNRGSKSGIPGSGKSKTSHSNLSASQRASNVGLTPSQIAAKDQNRASQGPNAVGGGKKKDFMSSRIDTLSNVLNDALDKGQKLVNFHRGGKNGPGGESGNENGGANDGEDGRRGSTVMRGKDKVTYRGSLAGLGGENAGGNAGGNASGNADGNAGGNPGGGGGPGGPAGQGPHGDQKKLNALTTRIDELSIVLADALQKGRMLSDYHKTTLEEQAEAAREAQALLQLEAQQEWEKAQEIKDQQEAMRLTRQAEYMQMLISQIDDMTLAVDFALAVLGPIDTIEGQSSRAPKPVRFTPGTNTGFATDDPGFTNVWGMGNHYNPGDNRGNSYGAGFNIPIVQVASPNGTLQPARFDTTGAYVHQEGPNAGHNNGGGRNQLVPLNYGLSERRPNAMNPSAGDANAGNVIARIDANTPDQWRGVDLTAVGDGLNETLQNTFGQHYDTMKGIFLGEIPMGEAPVHSIVLGISLGILVGIGIAVFRTLWSVIY